MSILKEHFPNFIVLCVGQQHYKFYYMLSVADDSLFSTWQHQHQNRKGRRANVHNLLGFFTPDILVSGQDYLALKETAKDLSVQLPRWGADIWGGLLAPGLDYPRPQIFGVEYWSQGRISAPLGISLKTSVCSSLDGAGYLALGLDIWPWGQIFQMGEGGYSTPLNPDIPPPGLQRLHF
jgi:hypothetical protein